MKEILFLAHRIPYPPNKGDKIRSYNLLKHLAKTYCVHVGAFVDDPADWIYAEDLRKLCGELKLLPLQPFRAKLKSLKGFLSGEALTVPYYADPRMSDWVKGLLANRPVRSAVVFSSAMAQYLMGHDELRRILDFVDVDSDKWRQYAERKSWPENWIYRREARCLLKFERRCAEVFDRSLFVSEHEAALFRSLASESGTRVFGMANGVDSVFFTDSPEFPNPYSPDERVMVFTGAMDYWANVDAVVWFAEEVFPRVKSRIDAARFYIVGTRPTEVVRNLARIPGVVVTGAVKDVRPYLSHARLAVAPLRIARGIQNKVLEAMSMGKSVLASPPALEGIEFDRPVDVLAADRPEECAGFALDILGEDRLPVVSGKNRDFVLSRYSWEYTLAPLNSLLEAP